MGANDTDHRPESAPTLYQTLIQAGDVGFCRRGQDGRFITANPAVLALLGVSSLSALQSREDDVPDSQAERAALMQRLAQEGKVSVETEWRTVNGVRRHVRIHAVPFLDARGRPAGYEAIVEDNAQAGERTADLRRALENAEAALRDRSVFLANLSHEVRTPLTAIIGFSSVLARELSGDSGRHAALIEQSGRRLVDTMNAVLTYADLDNRRHSIEIEPLDAVRVARETVDAFMLRAASRGVSLRVDAPDDASWMVLADSAALKTILENLVGNAIKFTNDGEITVSPRRVERGVVLEVADTGTGIAPEFLPIVFEPFKQESSGMARSHQGTGIGLTIAQRLAQLMGGEITVESTPGVGSRFSLHLVGADAADRHGTTDEGQG